MRQIKTKTEYKRKLKIFNKLMDEIVDYENRNFSFPPQKIRRGSK